MFHLFLNNHVNSLSVTGVQIQCPFLQALLLIIPLLKYQSISLAGLKVVCMILAFPPSIWLFSYFWLLRLPTTQTHNKLNFLWTSLNWRFVLLGVVTVFSSSILENFQDSFFLLSICALVLYPFSLIHWAELFTTYGKVECCSFIGQTCLTMLMMCWKGFKLCLL